MLTRPSPEAYTKALWHGFCDELIEQTIAGKIGDQEYRHDLLVTDEGFYEAVLIIQFTPHCATEYLARYGRKPHDHG